MNRKINFQEPFKSAKIKKYINQSLNANYYSEGIFHSKVKNYLSLNYGLKNTLITHSGTGALELSALIAKSSFPNKKVFLPSYTFSSTANAFVRAGFNLEFLDINKENFMIDFQKSIKIAQKNILVPVHYAGFPVDMEGYIDFKREGFLIEDAAQGLGTRWKNKNVGTFGNLSAFSFHHTKNIHGGYAGLISVNEKKYFEQAKFIYERGTDRTKVVAGLKNKYQWVEIGSSFQVPDLLAALIYAQLEDYDVINKKRKKVYEFYTNLFSSEDYSSFFKLPKYSNNSIHNNHSFFLIFNTNKMASDFIKFTKSKDVNCYIGYVPLHNSVMGKKLKLDKQLYNTETYGKRIVRLPFHTNLKNEDFKYISEVFDSYFKL